jgi:hypothetical protein
MADPRPGDLWSRTVEYEELLQETTVYVLVTGRAVAAVADFSAGSPVPVFPVLISSHTSSKDGTILESRSPRSARLYPHDFKALTLLSRSDEEALGGEESKSVSPSVSGV